MTASPPSELFSVEDHGSHVRVRLARGADLVTLYQAISAAFVLRPRALWDMREVDFHSFSETELQELASFARSEEQTPRRVALVAGEGSCEVLQRYVSYRKHGTSSEAQVFHSEDLALEWLLSTRLSEPPPV